jgi:Smg protein
MKENVLDVLMFLFENYFYDEPEEEPNRADMEENLHQAGFTNIEIEKAFAWLDGLADHHLQPELPLQADHPIRIYVAKELERLETDCRDFLLYLENVGILDAQRREVVLDRLMALESEEISLDDVKWVVLMVLFSQPGQELAYARMEDLVFEEASDLIH